MLQRNTINSNALCEVWPGMTIKLNEALKKYYPKQAFETVWTEEINDFLILIRLLPFKPGSRSLASPETFQNCVKRMLLFSKV